MHDVGAAHLEITRHLREILPVVQAGGEIRRPAAEASRGELHGLVQAACDEADPADLDPAPALPARLTSRSGGVQHHLMAACQTAGQLPVDDCDGAALLLAGCDRILRLIENGDLHRFQVAPRAAEETVQQDRGRAPGVNAGQLQGSAGRSDAWTRRWTAPGDRASGGSGRRTRYRSRPQTWSRDR